MLYKKILIVITILSLFSFFAPQKIHAQYVDVLQAGKEFPLDALGSTIGKMVLKKLTAQTVNWINSGFKGNPGYVTDPSQFFLDLGDSVAAKYLSETQLNKLCSPFQAKVRLALVKNYIQEEDNYACTLDKVKDNYDAFMQDFSQGGWDGWFEVTQTSGGNPYNAYFAAQSGLSLTVSSQTTTKQKELDLGNGLLSQKRCKTGTAFTQTDIDEMKDEGSWGGEEVGDCYEANKETVTPGVIIKDQLSKTLGSGVDQIVAADEITEIITALVTQLTSRIIGGIGDGLRGASEPGTDGTLSYTDQLRDEPQPAAVDPGSLSLNASMECVEYNDDGQCSKWALSPGSSVTGPDWLTPIDITAPTPAPTDPGTPRDRAPGLGGVCADIATERAKIPSADTVTAEEIHTILSNVAAAHNREGWGMLSKTYGYNCTGISCDIMYHGPTCYIYDVLGDAGGKTIPQCNFAGGITDRSRWVGIGADTRGSGPCAEIILPEPPAPPAPPPEARDPRITSLSPVEVTVGSTLTINGTDLTTTVQFFDSSGTRNTEVGQGGGTQTTIVTPSYLLPGNYTVKIYKTADSISNGMPLVIKGRSAPTIPVVPVTSRWTPPQTNGFGWWASMSPDGRYVAYGLSKSWVTDLDTKQSWDLAPAGLPAGGTCKAGQWITPSTLTYTCDPNPDSGGDLSRYEATFNAVNVSWTITRTADTSSLLANNQMVSTDGHWTAYRVISGDGRIVQDNRILASGVGGNISTSNGKIVFSCKVDALNICVMDSTGTILNTYQRRAPVFGTATNNDYIAYGGHGPVHGISPEGIDTDLTVAPWRKEGVGPGGIIYVGTTPWVVTTSWDEDTGNGFVFLRPFGDRRTLAIVADAVGASVGIRGNDFVIAYYDATGKMFVVTVPVNSERRTLN